ncbi:MAG: hypothetical protein NTY12_01235 [Candidatus Falkowbacteria bacterium]|nr:hypothetical protein [Candidatus Falkowbacteria bacterium]
MRLIIDQSQLSTPYHNFLRLAGYSYMPNRKTGQDSFVRPFGNNNYPRFHIYVNEEVDKIIFNAHLDQKQASYEGTSAHSGEYDSPLVKQELDRLKSLIGKPSPSAFRTRPKNDSPIENNDDGRARRFSNLFRNN